MSPAHTRRQNLTDAIVWLFETIVCAVIFSIGARFFFPAVIESHGWRTLLIGVSVWFLGAICATIDVRHRRRKRASALTP